MKTANEIFENGQHLSIELAKKLKGKRIACTSPEYRDNQVCVVEFVVGEIISEWDNAAKEVMDDGRTRQQYWESIMDADRIKQQKSTMLLLNESGKWRYRCAPGEHIFHGSDADRYVVFIEVEPSDTVLLITRLHEFTGLLPKNLNRSTKQKN